MLFLFVLPGVEIAQLVAANKWDSIAKALILGSGLKLVAVPWLAYNLYVVVTKNGACDMSWWGCIIASSNLIPVVAISFASCFIGCRLLKSEQPILPHFTPDHNILKEEVDISFKDNYINRNFG